MLLEVGLFEATAGLRFAGLEPAQPCLKLGAMIQATRLRAKLTPFTV